MTPFYRFVRGLIRAALGFYYREIEVAGAETVPKEGPLFLLANHHNGMVDPLIVIAASPRPVRYIGKAPLFKIPILGWFMRKLGCIPAHRAKDPGYAKEKNDELYVAVKEAFLEGGAIGIFPEGGSHTDPALAEFKHGAAKMALEAESLADFRLGLRAQLVAIHFERTRLFRGRVLVTFGESQPVAAYRERFAGDARGAVAALTRDLRTKLSSMVLDADTAEVERLSGVVERILRDEGASPRLEERFKRRKEVLQRYRTLRETRPAEVEGVRRLLRRYDQMLTLVGSGDGQIASRYRGPRILGFALANTAMLVLGAPVFAFGIALHAIPYAIARASAVLTGDDEDHRSSVGLLVAMVLFPLWYAGLAIAGWKLLPARAWIPLILCGPAAGYIALRWMER
ncbi:MAG TPA: lysophospholipid acyltransferase family protein, partial [Planctomycetota bacterium]|nr:lysophospholipid acyltransferase family protein [Planctomycetota bacterium]